MPDINRLQRVALERRQERAAHLEAGATPLAQVKVKHLALAVVAAALSLAAIPRVEWRLMKLGLLSYPASDPDFSRLPKRIPPGSIVILGDSIAHAAPWNGVNLGIGGIRSDQLDLRRYPPLNHARAVILSIGTNDVWQLRANGLGDRVSTILRQINAPVYLLAISSRHPGVDEANRELRLACQRNCTFIGPTRLLRRDDTHLTPEGYAELAARIRAYLVNQPMSACVGFKRD